MPPDRVILNARHPLRAFISVWTYLVSVWYLSLGNILLASIFHTGLCPDYELGGTEPLSAT